MIQTLQRFAMLSEMLIAYLTAFAYDFEQGGIYYKITSETDRAVEVTYRYIDEGDYSGDIVIPKKLIYRNNTYTVTSITDYAFSHCSDLTTVTIPNSVTSIGYDAFDDCSSLEAITVEAGNTVYCSEEGVLYNMELTKLICCPDKKSTVTIPNSITSIGSKAFSGCSGLTTVTIPNSVTSIGSAAFSGCSGLTTMTIPNSVTSIEISTFSECRGLTTVTIPNSVTSIGSSAFYYCSGLTSVSIPNSVTSIGSDAFYYCSGLTSVCIPNSVTSIDSSVFTFCRGLTSVTIPSSVTSIGSDAFSGCSGLETIYCQIVDPLNALLDFLMKI